MRRRTIEALQAAATTVVLLGAVIVGGVLAGGGSLIGRASAQQQGRPEVGVTISVLAGEQRFAFAPETTGEASVEVPSGTPVVVSAALEGNLTALGQWQLTVGPANGRGVSIGCNAPCTTTQVRVDGRPGDKYSARATVVAGGRVVAASPVVTVAWGNVGGSLRDEGMPERGEPVDPIRFGVVLGIGMLLVGALLPLSLPKRW